jgi:hypothetical protein
MEVEVAAVTSARVVLKATTLFVTPVWKFVPEMVTGVPGVPLVGLNPLMDGALDAATVNDELLVAEPFGLVTLIDPVAAPEGTFATMVVDVAEVTTAVVVLNFTVFCPGVGLKPVP